MIRISINRPLTGINDRGKGKCVENDEKYQLDATIMIYYHK